MGKQIRSLAALCLIVFLPLPIGARSGLDCQPSLGGKGSKLTGLILDRTGARVAQAAITVKNKRGKCRFQSDDNGEFDLPVPPGVYDVTIEREGFAPARQDEVKVRQGRVRYLTVYLELPGHYEPMPGPIPIEKLSVPVKLSRPRKRA